MCCAWTVGSTSVPSNWTTSDHTKGRKTCSGANQTGNRCANAITPGRHWKKRNANNLNGSPVERLADEPVALRGGLVVSVAALRLLWFIEDRQLVITLKTNAIRVTPASQVSPELKNDVKTHATEIAGLVMYCNDVDELVSR